MEYAYIAFPILYHWFTHKDHILLLWLQHNLMKKVFPQTGEGKREVHLLNAWHIPKNAGYMFIYDFF